ncbi:LacI family DNA-binding transcriptional regulator [Paenibacillus sp. MMS20-IR301]|uniref:LacI family DNA-binding transcriptional regulator n=1 Tax=Paenibacillus sp. MMS20-IR301 TaxID=2895946 RepID=UPI0028E35B9C|nr:LacI family DNA-binding transcriptional regulator [Paenibacillus sp. MMS20-IR301]WNS43553.1 LacI family DNA-binding transcriptional regulator [Paenibacillus sp. MMS20-IR301]
MDVNIKDIARISGVGISTVSRVINNKGLVSNATREKVLNVVKEYNYIPNSNARNLKTTQSKNIALMVKGITNPFFAIMIKEIERQVNLRGYPFLIHQVEDGIDEINAAIQLVKEKNLSGIIFMGGTYNHSEEKFKQLTVPFVLTTITTSQEVDPSIFSSVTINESKEAYKATNYLISLGHKHIGFLAKSPLLDETTGSRRLSGYKQALEENNLPYSAGLVEDCEYSPSSGFNAARRLLNRNREVTAIFAAADTIAIGAAKAVLTAGLSIPDDISIIGFDGIEMAEYYHPALDTISQPGTEMALTSVGVLFDLIAKRSTHQHIVYDAVLLKRGSCKMIKGR